MPLKPYLNLIYKDIEKLTNQLSIFRFTFVLVLCSALLFPAVQIGPMSLRIDDLILLVVPLFIFERSYFKNDSFLKLLLILVFYMIISMLHGYLRFEVPMSSRDLNEITRLSKPVLFAIFLFYLPLEFLMKVFYKTMNWGGLYIGLIGFIQFFDPLGIGSRISSIYTSESQIESATDDLVRRISLTGSGPNDGAIIAAYFFLYHFFSYVYTKNKKNLLLSLLLFSGLLFTSSRTTLVAVFISVIISILSSSQMSKLIKIAIISFFAVVIVFLIPYFEYIYTGFTLVIEGKNMSMLKRFDLWAEAYALFLESPFFGWGPAKAIHSTIVDGEYLLILRRFGAIGLLIILSIILFPVFLFKRSRQISDIDFKILYSMTFFFIPIALIVMSTNNFFSGYQSFLPFIFILILTKRLLEEKEELL